MTVGVVAPAQAAVGLPTLLPLGSLTVPLKVLPQNGPGAGLPVDDRGTVAAPLNVVPWAVLPPRS